VGGEALLHPPPRWRGPEWARQLAIEGAHFYTSLFGEASAIWRVAPGFVSELFRSGVYPSQMTFRKLAYIPERSDIRRLRELNPTWEFRPDFDPREWVIVLLHGYIDNSGAVWIASRLAARGYQVYLVRYPFLRGIRRLTGELADMLERIAHRERGKRIVPLGHSLGGFLWDHLLLHRPEVVQRYRMPLYIPMGSPHFGTLAAHLGIGQSAAEMLPGSRIVHDHLSRTFPEDLEVYPFVSRFDVFVLPIETALLRRGVNYVFSETGHLAQVARRETIVAIEEILASPREILEERAEQRPFWPSAFTWGLSQLPRRLQKKLGVAGILDYVLGAEDPPEFRIRIVHHELRTGELPELRHPPPR